MRFITDKKKKQIAEHLNSISDSNNPNNILPRPMDSDTALRELCRYFLGEDWYTGWPMGQKQINWEIVYEIETKFKGK